MDAETLSKFEAELKKTVPDLEIRFKDESRLQGILGALIYPFNPAFLKTFTTTYGSKVYFPSRKFYLSDPSVSFQVLAHEFVHIWDSRKDPFFKLKYMLPQVLVLIPVLLYGLLAWGSSWILLIPFLGYIFGALLAPRSKAIFALVVGASLIGTLILGWHLTQWKMLSLLGMVLIAPWPAPWRAFYELRGYGMNIALLQWVRGTTPAGYHGQLANYFVNGDYYFMDRDRARIERGFEATRQQAQVGALQGIPPYGIVYDFLYAHQMVHRVKEAS